MEEVLEAKLEAEEWKTQLHGTTCKSIRPKSCNFTPCPLGQNVLDISNRYIQVKDIRTVKCKIDRKNTVSSN